MNTQRSVYGSPTATSTATSTTIQLYSSYESRFRTHLLANYANSGYSYDDYAPAYRYGCVLATDPRYRDYDWVRLEPEAQRYWDANYLGTWDRVKNSIRDAWYEITGR